MGYEDVSTKVDVVCRYKWLPRITEIYQAACHEACAWGRWDSLVQGGVVVDTLSVSILSPITVRADLRPRDPQPINRYRDVKESQVHTWSPRLVHSGTPCPEW